jgi:hypothetical protein
MLDVEVRRRLAQATEHGASSSNEYIDSDLVTSLISTVVDFQVQLTAALKALTHYQIRWNATLMTPNDLEKLLLAYSDSQVGNTELTIALINYQMWTRAGCFVRWLITSKIRA